jgi:membrane-bound metal-dependent hydrolase YbcI (DUF457 family)
MPNGKTHVIIGAGTVGLLLAIANSSQSFLEKFPMFALANFKIIDWAVIAVVIYLYSQLPDIDADISKVNNIFNTGLAILIIYAVLNNMTTVVIIAAITFGALEWVKHRGITHTVLIGVVASWLLWFINPLWAIIGFVAFISHIVADGDFSWYK